MCLCAIKSFSINNYSLMKARFIHQGIQCMLMYQTLIARKITINQSYPTGITNNYPTEQAFVKGNPSWTWVWTFIEKVDENDAMSWIKFTHTHTRTHIHTHIVSWVVITSPAGVANRSLFAPLCRNGCVYKLLQFCRCVTSRQHLLCSFVVAESVNGTLSEAKARENVIRSANKIALQPQPQRDK